MRGITLHRFLARGKKGLLKLDDGVKASLLEEELAVPKGYLAVYVGKDRKRFVIPMSYLCLPRFKELMDDIAEEFGYEYEGGLRIPCQEETFVETLKILEEAKKKDKEKKKKKRA